MAKSKIKFSISHPAGLSLTSLRVDYKELNKKEIYAFQQSSAPMITIEGEIELTITTSKINIEVNAVGDANLECKLTSFKYKEKKLIDDEKFMINSNGIGHFLKTNISIV